jgi:uncharacterized protein YxeA
MKFTMKRALAFILTLAMITTTGLTAFAAETTDIYNTIILMESPTVSVAKTSDEQNTYTTTYDKENNTVQMVTTNNETGVSSASELVAIPYVEELQVRTYAAASNYLKENTFANYEYTKWYGNPEEWELRRPDSGMFSTYYFQTTKTNANSAALTSFKGYVDSINTQEGTIILNLGAVALTYFISGAAGAGALFTGGTLTAAAWASLVAAYGATSNYVTTLMTYDTTCKNAYDAYFTVYYA